jgi:hypothetical protein
MGPRQSKYGFLTVSPKSPNERIGKQDDIRLKGVLAHAKRQSKGPITLPPLRMLMAPRIDAANPAPMRKVEHAKKKSQPKGKAAKRKRK